MTDHRKKYPGEDRWLRDLEDVKRVTSVPRVGMTASIDGKPVKFGEAMVLDLLRRREAGTENDSLRSRRYDAGGAGGNSELTQTETAALRGLPGDDETDDAKDDWRYHEQPDPVGKLIEEALAEFDAMARASRKFEVKLMRILNAADGRRGRQSSLGQCQACGRDVPGSSVDRLRSGYCDRVAGPPVGPAWSGCYRKWCDQGRPDRVAFETWVASQLEIDGEIHENLRATRAGYAVDEITALQANGTLPAAS